MIPLVVALQLAPASASAPARPVPAAGPEPSAALGAQPPLAPEPGREAAETTSDDRVVAWLARLALGAGPAGFSAENEVLRSEGYEGGKLWLMLDGACLPIRHVGIGLWAALSYRHSAPANSPPLRETAFFVGAEVPLLLVGSRDVALLLTPRLGYAAGRLDFDTTAPAFQPPSWSPEAQWQEPTSAYQHTVVLGGELGICSFRHHVGAALGLLMAPVGPPGELGRAHDYGGLHVMLGGSVDG